MRTDLRSIRLILDRTDSEARQPIEVVNDEPGIGHMRPATRTRNTTVGPPRIETVPDLGATEGDRPGSVCGDFVVSLDLRPARNRRPSVSPRALATENRRGIRLKAHPRTRKAGQEWRQGWIGRLPREGFAINFVAQRYRGSEDPKAADRHPGRAIWISARVGA